MSRFLYQGGGTAQTSQEPLLCPLREAPSPCPGLFGVTLSPSGVEVSLLG